MRRPRSPRWLHPIQPATQLTSRGLSSRVRQSWLPQPSWLGVAALLLGSLVACHGAPEPVAPPAPAPQAPAPLSPRALLARAMAEIALRGPALDALSAEQREALELVTQKLPPDERSQLIDEGGPFPERRPLLHLIAGGNSPRARLALATSSAGVEMLLLTQGTKPEALKALLPRVREMAERAAAEWLRERSSSVGSSDALTAQDYQAVAQAAVVINAKDVAYQALGLAAEIEPNSDRFLELAEAAARAGHPRAAELALSHAGKGGDAGLRARVAPMVEAVLVLQRGTKLSLADGAAARLLVEDFAGAERLLGAAPSPADLSTSVLRSRAALSDSTCPDLPRGLASPLLCRAAFVQRATASSMSSKLDAAWAGGAGRDAAAVVGYVALRFAVPFLYGMEVDGKDERGARSALAARLRELEAVLNAAAAVSVRFGHAGVYVAVLAAAVEHPEQPSPAEIARLTSGVEQVLKCEGCGASALAGAAIDPVRAAGVAWSEAAVLAALTRVAGAQDVRPWLARLPADAHYLHTRAALGAWSGLVAGDVAGVEGSIAELAKLLESGFGRTDTVLELAELQHATERSSHTAKVLESAGKRLASSPLVFELRARGAVDAAGVLAAAGDLAGARALLEGVINKSPQAASRVERELLEITHSYLLILRARQSKGAERAELANELKGRAGPTLIVDEWRSLWVKELGRLDAKANCRGVATCVEAQSKRGRPSLTELERRVGFADARLLSRGLLGIRSADLALAVEAHTSLKLEADFRPLWLAVEVPY